MPVINGKIILWKSGGKRKMKREKQIKKQSELLSKYSKLMQHDFLASDLHYANT
jgi:hypothetical protein